jgi:hypothetical protein
MTDWVLGGHGPANFSVDQDAELRAGGDKAAAVRYVKHALDSDDIQKHIKGGKQCMRLALTFNDRVSFVLTENLDIKRVAAQDILDQSEQNMPVDAHMQTCSSSKCSDTGSRDQHSTERAEPARAPIRNVVHRTFAVTHEHARTFQACVQSHRPI